MSDEGTAGGLLCIGDDFALQTIAENGKVGFVTTNQANGGLYCDVLPDSEEAHPKRPLCARFTLHPPAQYAASRAMQKWAAKITKTSEDEAERRAQLESDIAAEEQVNDTELELAWSSAAIFGGTFQLHQALGDTYLHAHQSVAEEDSTALRASMSERQIRSKMLWFSIRPGFRTRTEGEEIRMGDTVVIETLKMPGMYLHTEISSDGRDRTEVNVCDRATRFRIVPVSRTADKALQASGAVCGGDYVQIFQRQSMSFLNRSPGGEARLVYGDSSLEEARADMLWQLVTRGMQWSGTAVQCSESKHYSLQDALSRLYLSADESQGLKFVENDTDRLARWKLVPFEATSHFHVDITQFWLVNAASGHRLCQRDAAGGSAQQLFLATEGETSEADLFVFRALSKAWVADFVATSQQVDLLKRFRSDCADSAQNGDRKQAVEAIRLKYLIPDTEIVSDSPWTGPALLVLERLLLRLTSSSDLDPLTRDGVVNEALQRQLTELRLVQLLLDELLPTLFELVSPQDISDCVYGPYLLRLVQYSYRVVTHLAKSVNACGVENSQSIFARLENIATFMDSASEFRVATLLIEVFSDAEQLMRTISDEFISRMWKLGTTRRASRFVLFIGTLLTIKGRPLKFNQDRVIDIVREGVVPGLFDVDFQADAPDRIDYHISLIQLAAALCAGRHRASIDFFLTEVGLSYLRILEILNGDQMDSSIRIVYTMLMRALFIDREPHVLNMPVQPNRMMPPLRGTAAEIEERLSVKPVKQVDPYSGQPDSIRPTPGFSDLKKAILHIFGNVGTIRAKDAARNEFLCEVVVLAHQMLLFGLMDDEVVPGKHHDGVLKLGPESILLATNILSLVDGRTDDMSGLDAEETGTAMRFRVDLSETSTIMSLKKQLLLLINDLFSLRSSTRINKLLDIVMTHRPTILQSKQSALSPRSPIALKLSGDPKAFTKLSGDEFQNPMVVSFDGETFESEGNSQDASQNATFEDESSAETQLSPRATGAASPRAAKSSNEDAEEPANEALMSLADEAMKEAASIRVYSDQAAEKSLVDSLLDMLRYRDDADLCFGAFNTLVFFVSQNFVLVQTLSKVSILGTKDEARNFILAAQDVSEFRRLRKWLNLVPETQQCIDCCKMLLGWCQRPGGQDLMRNLNLEEYLIRVLRMRMTANPRFPELLRCCMQLTGEFCRGHTTNQFLVARHLRGDAILLNLLEDSEYYSDAAAMICCVVQENEDLSVMYTDKLMAKVGELAMSPDHGRQQGLLQLLEVLLVVDNHPVESSQVAICKGAMKSRVLVETVGDVQTDEWGNGPYMSRMQTIKLAAQGDKRATLGCQYYCTSLNILSICARGKMPATELLCASMIPYEDCLARLHELYNEQDLHKLNDSDDNADPSAMAKGSLLSFFREVFVDTNSEHILRALRRPANGIWIVEDHVSEEDNVAPIAKRLLHDLKRLAKSELGLPPPGELRNYLFEQVVLFFIQYCSTAGPTTAAKEEADVICSFYVRAGSIADTAVNLPGLTRRESVLLTQLSSCARKYAAGVDSHEAEIEQELARAAAEPIQAKPASENSLAWSTFVDAAVQTVPVRTVKGTDRLVGQGMVELGQKLWQPVDTEGGEGAARYSSFLVGPMRRRLQMCKSQQAERDAIPKLLTILDTVRAIPYAVSAATQDKVGVAFFKFVEVCELDARSGHPDLAASQKEMVDQGWALLCFEVLSAVELQKLHLTCLRLLLAMTGGGSREVQDAIFAQVTNTPVELLGFSCRRLLRAASAGLKAARKAAAAREKGNVSSHAEDGQHGFALETLTLLDNLCTRNHSPLQDYIRAQMGHSATYDVISDVVSYANQLERDIKLTVAQEVARQSKPSQKQSQVLTVAQAAFDVLRSLASGPNLLNQRNIANSDILSVVNRILVYTGYTTLDDIDEAGPTLNTAKGNLNGLMSSVLLSLCEGSPDDVVVHRVISAVDWSRIAGHLATLRKLMEWGLLDVQDTGNSPSSTSEVKSHKGIKRSKRQPAGTSVPLYVFDKRTRVCAEWLSSEAFRWFTVCEKLRIAGKHLQDKSSRHAGILEAMGPVFKDVETMAFFTDRVGQVEVVRNHELERLFFLLPANHRSKKDAKMIQNSITKVIDRCPREDPGEKLRAFTAGAYEIAAMVESQDSISKSYSPRLPRYFAWFNRHEPTLYLSGIISAVAAGTFDRYSTRGSLDADTFGRTGNPNTYFNIFLVFATLHFVLTVVRVYAFMVIRFPVLKELYARQAKLDYLSSLDDSSAMADGSFSDNTVLLYGLPWRLQGGKTIDAKFLSSRLRRYGVIAVSRVVLVEPTRGKGWEDDTDSWAVVHFSNNAAVTNIMIQENNGGYITVRGRKKNEQLHWKVFRTSSAHIEQSPTLSHLMENAELELNVKSSDPFFVTATQIQSILDKTPLGRFVPVVLLYIFRKDMELYGSMADVAFSAAGIFYSPLLFSWHLFKITASKEAAIVVASMTHNITRLSVTVLLCLLFAWVFSVTGLLWFDRFHMKTSPAGDLLVANEGGPCANLLTCFATYSYSGLMQAGIGQWMTLNKFPERGFEVVTAETLKTLWEVSFSMIAMFVVSIITGIICDTFGELRGQIDEAIDYRTSTCFITGIPFARVGEEKSTDHLQYAYLFLYLRRKKRADLSPLERMVAQQIDRGEIEWIPDARCFSSELQDNASEGNAKEVMMEIDGLKKAVGAQTAQMAALMEQMVAMQAAITKG